MNLKWQVRACGAIRFGGGLIENCAQISFRYGVVFAEEDKKVVRRALPAWAKVLDIKEFPKDRKVKEGWVVYHRCYCRTDELMSSKTRHTRQRSRGLQLRLPHP